MQKLLFAHVAGLTLISLAVTAPTAQAKTCVLAGGEATMVTKDLADFMANAALKNSMKDKGLTPQGSVKLTCNAPSPLTYCLAQQKACK